MKCQTNWWISSFRHYITPYIYEATGFIIVNESQTWCSSKQATAMDRISICTRKYTKEFTPWVSTVLFINNRYLYFLTNCGAFQQHILTNKGDSSICVCSFPSTFVHYILSCTLTSQNYIKNRQHAIRKLSGLLIR